MRKKSGRDSEAGASRRAFLRRGGIVAAGGVAAAAALPMARAGAGAPTTEGPIVPAYIPSYPPTRIYDSRTASGKISNTQTRTLTPTSTSGLIAIAVNVTVANTEGTGYLSLFPGDTTWPGTSSINWFTPGMELANNALIGMPANESFKVFCGGTGATQFIIDLIGVTIPWDTAAITSADDYRAYAADLTAGIGTWTEA